MSEQTAREAATKVLTREAALLDHQQWHQWLDLYTEDSKFWVPTWRSESEPTSDPTKEMSHIYFPSRGGLEDRVHRIQSGLSPASIPVTRTVHLISNIEPVEFKEKFIRVTSNWVVHAFFQAKRQSHSFFGFYEHELRHDKQWRIQSKKITLLNDYLPGVLDFYHL